MSYQVLARKCRPQRFSEIVGQEHITRTLQNAIDRERVGHAYLFVGPRGTGKTTTARIFAKALNCEKGKVKEPCCECRSCQEIANGSSLDVMEIDGASHNKVEHVRDLRDNVQYTPNRSRYKIYIIDEVHMLTTQAWNALLKTLEEPPPHVKFFFATTEPHKVLPTIMSRCQRFDLKRLSVPLIANRLKEIADGEGIQIDERARVAIARAADGAMRDGQSIFDQIIAFCGNEDNGQAAISEEDVTNVFGLASGRELTDLAKAAATNDVQAAIEIIHNLAERGRDLERLLGDLVLFLRNAMVYQVCREPQNILDVSDAEMSDIAELSQAADARLIQRLLEGLADEEGRLRSALNKRVYLEVALVQVMHRAHEVQIDKIIQRLNELRGTELPNTKKKPDNPSPSAAKAATHSSSPNHAGHIQQSPETPEKVKNNSVKNTRSSKTQHQTSVTGASDGNPPGRTAPPLQTQNKANPPPDHNNASSQLTNAQGTTNATPAHQKPPSPVASEQSKSESDPQEIHSTPHTENIPAEVNSNTQAPENATTTAPKQSNEADNAPDLWHDLIEAVEKIPKKHQLKTYMQEMRAVAYNQNCLQVAYDAEFPEEHVQVLLREDNLQTLENTLRRVTGAADARILIKRWVEGVSDEATKPRLVSSPEVRERVENNSFVRNLQQIFNAELIDVRG